MDDTILEATPTDSSPSCAICNAVYDLGDNFCRQCGARLTLPMPATPRRYAVASRPSPNPVVRGAIIMVAGTVAPILARKALAFALRPKNIVPLVRGGARAVQALTGGTPAPSGIVESETILMKRVRVRR